MPTVFIACLISAADGAITQAPQNAIGLRDDAVTLQCQASPGVDSWIRDNEGIVDDMCQALDSDYSTAPGSSSASCSLVVQGTSSTILSGPFTCFDGTENAEAAIIVIDPAQSCEPTSTAPFLRNQPVTFACIMTYYWRSALGTRPRATLSASIEWQSTAGTQTTYSPVTNNDDSVKLQVDVSPDTSGTEIPSYTCTATFAFVDNVNDANLELAVNSVSWTCLSEHITLAYCPTMATITPSSGDFNAGDVLTCSADGSPEPSYSWTDSGGAEVSTTNTMTLSGGAFELTCTATGSASTTSCSVSSTTTSGFALGCPGNMAASASGQVLVNSDITCTSTGGAPDPTYQWLNIDGSVLSSTATVTITATGDFNYTCVATSTHTDGRECVAMYSVTGTGVTELSPTTASSNGGGDGNTDSSAGNGTGTNGNGNGNGGSNGNGTSNGQTGTSSGMSIFLILTIIFSILIGLGLIWIFLLTCWLLGLIDWYPGDERERREKEFEPVEPPRSYPVRAPHPFQPYPNGFYY